MAAADASTQFEQQQQNKASDVHKMWNSLL